MSFLSAGVLFLPAAVCAIMLFFFLQYCDRLNLRKKVQGEMAWREKGWKEKE